MPHQTSTNRKNKSVKSNSKKKPSVHPKPKEIKSTAKSEQAQTQKAEKPLKLEKIGRLEKAAKRNGKRGAPLAVITAPGKGKAGEEGKSSTRLALIKARHEAMKREIDQIREDLESDEEE